MSRIGVFICHCGENIAKTVDCARVAEAARKMPGVAFATDYRYTCSDPGQAQIREATRKLFRAQYAEAKKKGAEMLAGNVNA